MLTPFGVEVRKLRLDKGLRLLDVARTLGLTSAHLSAIETGKKAIPRGHVEVVSRAMKLSHDEHTRLQRAADQTRPEVRVDNLRGSERELVAAFARRLDDLPPSLLADIKKQVFKAIDGDTPFKRSRRGLLVAPLSTAAIWGIADQVRSLFTTPDQHDFPVMDVLEFRLEKFVPGFVLDPCDEHEMGGEEGRVVAGENRIQLRNDVYERAWSGSGRDRFTACHELGHLLMHRKVALARIRQDAHPIYRDAEWQADTFAGGLMLCRSHLATLRHPSVAAARCGMTTWAADVMWSKYQKEGLC